MKTKKRLSLNRFLVCKIGDDLKMVNGGDNNDPNTAGTHKTILNSSLPCWLDTKDPNGPTI